MNISDSDSEELERVKKELHKEAGMTLQKGEQKETLVEKMGKGVEQIGKRLQE